VSPLIEDLKKVARVWCGMLVGVLPCHEPLQHLENIQSSSAGEVGENRGNYLREQPSQNSSFCLQNV